MTPAPLEYESPVPAAGQQKSRGGRLIVFTRYPEPGKCKTRLIPALGAEGAAYLQRSLILRTLAWARLLEDEGIGLEVHFDGPEAPMRAWLGRHVGLAPQSEGDLGCACMIPFPRFVRRSRPRGSGGLRYSRPDRPGAQPGF